MARKPWIERVGFYYIANRGVARGNIYKDRKDFIKFLKII